MILKIIGIILGSILGILLLLLLLFLFVPVRYGIHLECMEDKKVTAYVSWFLHLVHFRIWYEKKETKYCLRIFGLPVKQNITEKKTKKTKVKKQKRNKVEKTGQREKMVKKDLSYDKIEPTVSRKKLPMEKNAEAVLTEQKLLSDKAAVPRNIKREKGRKKEVKNRFSFSGFFKKGKEGIHNFIRKGKKKRKKLKKSIQSLLSKKNHILELIRKDTTKHSIGKVKTSMFGLLRYMGPQKIKGTFKYGMEDPSQTGMSLGLISVIFAYYDKKNRKLRIIPDFEHKVFEADVNIKGRFRFIRMLFVTGKLVLDKEFKAFIKDVKMLKEEF